MAKYRVIGPTWLHLEAGGPQLLNPYTEVTGPDGKPQQIETVIEFDGWPNSALEPMDDQGRELVEAVHRLRSTKQLPATPAAWRADQERKRRESREQQDA